MQYDHVGNDTDYSISQYDVRECFYEGLSVVGKAGKFGFIDKTGNIVIPLQYDGAFSFREGVAIIYQG